MQKRKNRVQSILFVRLKYCLVLLIPVVRLIVHQSQLFHRYRFEVAVGTNSSCHRYGRAAHGSLT